MINNKVMAPKSTLNRKVKYLFVLFGIWPGGSCMTFCRVLWGILLVFVEVCQYRYLHKHFYSSDLFDLMECFSVFIGYIQFTVEISIFWWKERILHRILKLMAQDWDDCANNDIEMRKVARKAKLSDHIANAIITLHTTAVLFYSMGIVLNDVDITNCTTGLPHIYKMEIPFDITTQVMYRFILMVELTHAILNSCVIGAINAVLLITLALHVGGQIDILLGRLAELVSANSVNKHKSNIMGKIIQKHQKIIYFTENIENLYTFIALMQFVSNIAMICVLGFLIIIALDSPDAMEKIMRSLSFYSVTNIEAFMFCYAGEYFINKSKEIGYTAYDCAWYDMKPKHSRILLLIILRSQKHLGLTIGTLMDLSLQRFASIMNSAVSYISVLLAMK